MKKWKVSELFSQISIPAEELPDIHTDNEISAKNVKSRVLAKIENTEVITTAEPGRKDMTKRLMLGLGIAAALVAGGVGAYSSSDVGSRVKENPTHATIDSKPMQIMTEETMLSSGTSVSSAASGSTASGSAAAETEQVIKAAEESTQNISSQLGVQPVEERYSPPEVSYDDISNYWENIPVPSADAYTAPYDMNVTDSMDSLDVIDAKVSVDGANCFIKVTFRADLPEGITPADLTFGLGTGGTYFMTQYGSGGGRMPEPEIIDENTFTMTYTDYGFTVNAVENTYVIDIHGIEKTGAQEVTELGMKNVLGFTNAEIAQGRQITDAELAQLQEDYIYVESVGSYMKKSDIIDTGRMTIYIDPSPREFPVGKDNTENYTRARLSNGSYMIDDHPIFTDSLSMMSAEVHAIEMRANTCEYVIRYTGKNGYEFTGDEDMSIFADSSVQAYGFDENGAPDYYANAAVISDTWVDIHGVTNCGTPCMYQKITVSATEHPEMRVLVSNYCLKDRDTGSIIETGNLDVELPCNFWDEADMYHDFDTSFTTSDGFTVDMYTIGDEITLTWQGTEESFIPEFLQTYSGEDFTLLQAGMSMITDDKFTIVQDNGFRYRSRMALIIDDNYRVTLTAVAAISGIDNEISSIEYDGKAFYTRN